MKSTIPRRIQPTPTSNPWVPGAHESLWMQQNEKTMRVRYFA